MNKAYMNLVAGGIEAAKKHIPEVRPKYQTTTILKKVANGMTFLCVPLGERENYAVKHGFKLRTLQRHTQQYKEGRFDRPNIHITRNVIENPREGRYDQYFPLLKTVVSIPSEWTFDCYLLVKNADMNKLRLKFYINNDIIAFVGLLFVYAGR